jgi:hypothetical protein
MDRDLDFLTRLPTELLAAILAWVPFHGGLPRVCRRFRDVLRELLPVSGDKIERNLVGAGVLFWRGAVGAEAGGPLGMVTENLWRRNDFGPVSRVSLAAARTREARLQLAMPGPNPLVVPSILNAAGAPPATVAGDRGDYEVATNTIVGSGRDTVSVFHGLDIGTMVVQTLRLNLGHGATLEAVSAGAVETAPGIVWSTDMCRELADRARTVAGLSEASRQAAVALYKRAHDFIETVCQPPGRQREPKFLVFRMGVAGMPRVPRFQFHLVVPVYNFRLNLWRWTRSGHRQLLEAGPGGSPGLPSRTQEVEIVRDEATGRVVSVAFTTCLELSSDSIPHTLWRLKRGGAQQIDVPRAKRAEFRLYMRNVVVPTPETRAQLEAEVSGLERDRKRDGARI